MEFLSLDFESHYKRSMWYTYTTVFSRKYCTLAVIWGSKSKIRNSCDKDRRQARRDKLLSGFPTYFTTKLSCFTTIWEGSAVGAQAHHVIRGRRGCHFLILLNTLWKRRIRTLLVLCIVLRESGFSSPTVYNWGIIHIPC